MSKIATRQYCNTLQPNSFTDDLTRCPANIELRNLGFKISGPYRNNQLVKELDIQSGINYIHVSVSREYETTIKATPTFTDIPQETLDSMSITLVFYSGYQIVLGKYSWNATDKCWFQYSHNNPDYYNALNVDRSSISITEDSKYKYALVKPEKQIVVFQFIVIDDELYMALNKKIKAYEPMIIQTNVGDFNVPNMGWYSESTVSVNFGFSIASIKVTNIPETAAYEFRLGVFNPKIVTISTTSTTAITNYQGRVTIETYRTRSASGSPGRTIKLNPLDIDGPIFMTYEASPAGHTWIVKNTETENTYTLKDGVRTHVGYANEDTVFDFITYQ